MPALEQLQQLHFCYHGTDKAALVSSCFSAYNLRKKSRIPMILREKHFTRHCIGFWHGCVSTPSMWHCSECSSFILCKECPNKQFQCRYRRLGLQWVSAVDDLLSVRKALAAGLFANAAQYMSTTVESRDKEHTGVDLYHLVRSTGTGQPSALLLLSLSVRFLVSSLLLGLL